MPDSALSPEDAAKLRSYLLAQSPSAGVARELWSCSAGTYSSFRECILARKRQAAAAQQLAYMLSAGPGGRASPGGEGGGPRATAAAAAFAPHSLPATVKYSFEGVKHVLAEAAAAVTALAFASLRADLLAFGCADGELWRVALPPPAAPHAPPTCAKARKMHGRAVTALDWAYDNSQLLSVGGDGSLCVWDAAAPGGLECIRSIHVPTTAFLCGRFHRVNFSLALVGTSAGAVEVYNCSNGILHSRYPVAPQGGGLQVTALDSSNHHVFLGDSSGVLHLFACEMKERQLSRLRPTGRLRLTAPGQPPAPVTALQYAPFCRATDSAVLLAALQDGSLCIVKANEAKHTAELHLRRFVPPPSASALLSSPSLSTRPASSLSLSPASSSASSSHTAPSAPSPPATWLRLRPAMCPLSVIQDVPLITYGSDDTSVYIVDVTARSFAGGAAGRGGAAGAGGAGGGAGGGGGGSAAVDRPLTVTVLKAHRAAVTVVGWSYDESLLASADADGTLVLWQRCRLF